MNALHNRPIGVFDSGMGGLSVLAPTAALLPHAPLVYVADSAGFPYGTRSEGEIARLGGYLVKPVTASMLQDAVAEAKKALEEGSSDRIKEKMELLTRPSIPVSS